mmetsp:Transcript_57538/g.134777  ORF Transcript_57538/g.134777 Transcript_57538/m.134777 type:complete len:975 (-) Transcript_57538:79-3003(-)
MAPRSPSSLKAEDFPDIIQFSSAVCYCNEAEGKVHVQVIRLGEDDDECHVDYETFNISAVSGVKFVGKKGSLTFGQGQMAVTLEIKLIENDAFEATLEFGVRLMRPRNCVLGAYLHTCRVTIADDDTFPTNRNADKLKEGRAAEIQPVALWLEYLRMSLKDRKVWYAATLNVMTDQVRNLSYLWQVMLTKYLIDQVMAEEVQPFFTDPMMPSSREGRVWVTISLSFVPHVVMLLLNRMKAERRIQGMVVNQLQGNLLRKFLNYNEDSRDSVSTSDLAMAITRDVPELVEHGFMGCFNLVENLGLVLVLGILMLAQSTQLTALTPICFLLIPIAMLMFIYIRHPETERRDRLVFTKQTEMLILVHQVTDNTRLITDYYQRPNMVVSFNERVAECNKATTSANMFRVTNAEFAPFMTTVVIALYVIFNYAAVLEKDITIGEFLTSVAVWRSIGGAYQNAYKDMLQIQQAAAPLLNVIHYMNLPVDTHERMEIVRELQESGMVAQEKAHTQLFSNIPAHSPFVEPSGVVSMLGEKVAAKYPQDLIQIYADNISFAYPVRTGGGIDLFQNASFMIPQGQLVAVAGPKGSGKKTLLELLAGILLPTGHTKLFVPPHLRVLHVSKDPQMLPEISLFENLTFGPSDGQDEEPERVIAICRRLGISNDALQLVETSLSQQGQLKKAKAAKALRQQPQKNPATVSGSAESSALRELQEQSMNQENSLPFTDKCLLHLARAFVMNPEVLILHKPLEHFDNIFARRVVEILREFVDSRGLEKPRNTLHLRSPRTCIFSVGHLDNLEDVDMLLQVSNKQVESVDLVSLCQLKKEVGQIFHVLDTNVDNLLDMDEFLRMSEVSPGTMELFGVPQDTPVGEARRRLTTIFGVVDDSGGGNIDQEEFLAFIRDQFDDRLAEAVECLKQPAGAVQRLAEIQKQKVQRKQQEIALSPIYQHLDAWDSPDIPIHTADKLSFPDSSKKLPLTF